jgi:hypothetical protein
MTLFVDGVTLFAHGVTVFPLRVTHLCLCAGTQWAEACAAHAVVSAAAGPRNRVTLFLDGVTVVPSSVARFGLWAALTDLARDRDGGGVGGWCPAQWRDAFALTRDDFQPSRDACASSVTRASGRSKP